MVDTFRIKGEVLRDLTVLITLIMLAGVVANVGHIVALLNPIFQTYLGIALLKFIFMGFGFILIPTWIVKRLGYSFDCRTVQLSTKSSVFYVITILLVNQFFLKSQEILIALVVACCEEYLFRSLARVVLKNSMNNFVATLITSILFGVVLHMNGDIWVNVAIKVPAGMFLSYLAQRFGLSHAIAFHWLHNVFVGLIV